MPALPPPPAELVLRPSRLALERALAPAAGEVRSAPGDLTFGALWDRLAAPSGRRLATPLITFFVTRAALAAVGAPWSALVSRPAAVQAVARALAELRLAGVTAGHLGGHRGSTELASLAELLGEYEAGLERRGLFDEADRRREAVLAVARGAVPAPLAGVRRVRVEGGASLFGARLDLLAAFAARGVEVDVRLPFDVARRGVFAWPEASLHRLEASGAAIGVRLDARDGTGPLAPLRRAQFGGGEIADAPVRLIEVGEPGEHARAAAAVVAAWARAGVPPQEMVVACADFDAHAPAVLRELAAVGVAARTRVGPSLGTTRVATLLGSAFSLPQQGYPREALIDCWLARAQWVDTPGGRWSPERVARWLCRAGVRSERVGGYRSRLAAYAQRAGEDERAAVEPVLAALAAFMQGLEALPAEAPVLEELEAAARVGGRLLRELVPAVAWDGFAPPDPVAVAAAAREREAGALLGDLLRGIGASARAVGSQGVLSRRELAAMVGLFGASRRLGPRGVTSPAVQVLQLEDLVETTFSRVLLVGVDAEVFPATAAVAADGVLTDELRAEINARIGPRLLQLGPLDGRPALRADARDLWLWLEALAACRDELAVTITRSEGGGDTGRSEVVAELARSLGGRAAETWAGPQEGGVAYSLAQARLAWAAGRPRGGALVPASWAGLDAALRRRDGPRLTEIERRVAHELALESRPHVTGALAHAQRVALAGYLTAGVHATSHLDALGTCAFRWLALAVLRLTAEEVPPLGADARGEGSLVHAALEAVYADLRARGGLTAARRAPQAARDRARAVLEAARERLLHEVVVHPLLEPAALEAAGRLALRQLDRDLAVEDGSELVALEYRFDDRAGAAAPPLVVTDPAGRRALAVRGSVDRIDRVGRTLVAIDYKRSPRKRPAGRHFQLPVYLAAGLRDFGEGVTAVAAAWLGPRDGREEQAVEPMTPAELGDVLSRDVWARLDRVLRGDVSPDPEPPRACEHCEFGALCRYRAVPAEADA